MDWDVFAKETKIKTHKRAEKALNIFIVGVLILFIFLCAFSFTTSDNYYSWSGEYFTQGFTGSYLDENGSWVPLPDDLTELNHHRELTLRGHFTKPIKENQSIMFYLNHINLIMSINSEQVFKSSEPLNHMTHGSMWKNYISQGITTTDEIELTITYDDYFSGASISSFLNNIQVGSERGLYSQMIVENGFSSVVGLIILSSGLVILIAALTITDLGLGIKKRLLYFSGLTISGGLSGIASQSFSSLFVPHPEFNDIWSYSCRFFTLLFLLIYVFTLMSNRKCKDVVLFSNFILTTIAAIRITLHFLNVYPIHASSQIQTILIMILVLICIASICYEAYKIRNKRLLNFIRCLWLVAISACIDTICLYTDKIPSGARFRFIYLAFIVFVFLQIFALVKSITRYYINLNKLKAMEAELSQSKISIMLSQIQPHFLYNSLATISALSDEPKVAEAIDEFSSFLRGNMDSLSATQPIEFSKELEHTKHYLSLEKMRFDERLKIEYDIKTTSFLIPTLTLQPIVENAVKYGMRAKEDGVTVKISTYESNDSFVVTVKDNGCGFKNKPDDNKSHIGISNVEKRLSARCNGELIINSADDVGTTVTIILPKEKNK